MVVPEHLKQLLETPQARVQASFNPLAFGRRRPSLRRLVIDSGSDQSAVTASEGKDDILDQLEAKLQQLEDENDADTQAAHASQLEATEQESAAKTERASTLRLQRSLRLLRQT